MDVTKGRTKADTLSFLAARGMQYGEVLPLFSIQYQDWRTEARETKLDEVLAWYSASGVNHTHPVLSGEVLVRSSSLGEDNEESSNAGRFLTLQHVRVDDKEVLRSSIHQVFGSYLDGISDADQVLIQPQLTHIKYSGVLLTRSVSQFSPYDAISYDDRHANEADLVTSGKGDVLTWYKFRNESEISTEKQFRGLLLMARELEKVFGHDHLDVEFAICSDGSENPNPSTYKLFLLQARTLVSNCNTHTYKPIASLGLTKETIETMARKFRVLSREQVGLLGSSTVFSSMVDWNPAEIIGCEPRTLARTMYQYIITERVWAEQRRDYGYRDVTGFPLMHTFGGVPYIDVRVDFNSWIPKTVSPELAQKLINYFLKCLVRRPELHDKVEFEILFTCYFPGIKEELVRRLRTNNDTDIQFTDSEIAEYQRALWNLTNDILAPVASATSTTTTTTTMTTTTDASTSKATTITTNAQTSSTTITTTTNATITSTKTVSALVASEFEKVKLLDEMREAVMGKFYRQKRGEQGEEEGDPTPGELISTIHRLLQVLKSHGTLPFAGLARCGFIAVQFLRSLNQTHTLPSHLLERFMSHSVHTVTKQLSEDVEKVRNGKMAEKDFLNVYGHLRPGTYDVTSLRYDEGFDLYFGGTMRNGASSGEDGGAAREQRGREGKGNNGYGNDSDNEYNEGNGGESNGKRNHSNSTSSSYSNNNGNNDNDILFPEETMEAISEVFKKEMGFSWSCSHILNFIKESIEGREYSKFIFSRCLSDVLSLLLLLGSSLGLSREEMSFVNINTLIQMHSEHHETNAEIREKLLAEIAYNKKQYEEITQMVLLPPLISSPTHFWEFHQFAALPNFITNKRIVAPLCSCDGLIANSTLPTTKSTMKTRNEADYDLLGAKLSSSIAMIRSADPGYDWLFSRGIKGLITQYGGVNSHMSIRCAELGIPAVIGCGTKNYDTWKKAKCLDIDCGNKVVNIIS